jgi:hypothetical protein
MSCSCTQKISGAKMTTSSARQFYEEQLDYIAVHDVDGLIDNHYNEEAVLTSLDFEVRGRAALKDHFRGYLKRLGSIKVISTDHFVEGKDTIFFDAHVMTDLGAVVVFDALVLKNGKISYHFTGVK